MDKKYSKWFILIPLFYLLAIGLPNKFGQSLYAHNELIRDLNVLKYIDRGGIVLLGPVSSLDNFHFGPIYYYLLYPFIKIFGFNLWAMGLTSLIFVLATVLILYFFVKDWSNSPLLAFITACIASTSIITFQLTQYASNPNFVPFFTLLFFWALYNLSSKKDKLYTNLILLSLSFSILTQLHAVPLISLPLIVLYLTVKRRLILTIKQWLIFAVIVLTLWSPYLYYEYTHNFINLRSLVTLSGDSKNYITITDHITAYIGAWLSPIFSLNNYYNYSSEVGSSFYYSLLFALLIIYITYLFERRNKNPKLVNVEIPSLLKKIGFAWFIIPSALLLLPFGALSGLHYYYYFLLLPFIFMTLGLVVYKLFQEGFVKTTYLILILYLTFQMAQVFQYHYIVKGLH